MVPLVDFLNHSPTSRVGHIVERGSEFVLMTQDDIEPRRYNTKCIPFFNVMKHEKKNTIYVFVSVRFF